MSASFKFSGQSEKEMEMLYQISQAAATRPHTVSELLMEVLDVMETELGVSRGTFTLRNPDTDIFVIEASRGLTPEEEKRGQYKLGEGVTGEVARGSKSALIPDITKDPRFLNRTKSRATDKQTAFICVPIIHKKKVIGTMSIDLTITSDLEELSRYQRFLELVANILAEAVASIREELEEREGLLSENERLRRQLGERYRMHNIIGNCSAMRSVYEQIVQVADSTATVLIRGESGTGKELVARAVHYGSERRNNAFVSVNCAALPENLIESELFGHEKGAFTSAIRTRVGRFELADGGTIFLDEIADMSPKLQVKLLRVLQEHKFERIGGAKTLSVDIRVITATNKNLRHAVQEGRFREDLFYRLNVIPVTVPPLRERRTDIPLLVGHFLKRFKETKGGGVQGIDPDAMEKMVHYAWPGNIRELENIIERMVILADGDILTMEDLPGRISEAKPPTPSGAVPRVTEDGVDFNQMVEDFENQLIEQALELAGGVKNQAAKLLNLNRTTLVEKMKKKGMLV
jgi:Nif-specific regulatory protein